MSIALRPVSIFGGFLKAMAFWTQYITHRLIDDEHPVLCGDRCINRLQIRHTCTVCREICPGHVFDGPVPDWTRCIGCGLCCSACPSRCISMPRLLSSRLYELAAYSYHTITVTCLNDFQADIRLETPGCIPWELWCTLALRARVSVITGSCADCGKKESCAKLLRQETEKACKVLSDLFPDGRIHLTADPEEISASKFTRRGLFTSWIRRSGDVVKILLPDPGNLVPDGTLWRQILSGILEKSFQTDAPGEEDENSGGHPSLKNDSSFCLFLPLAEFTDSCTACGMCEKLCPRQAVKRVPGPEGSGRWYMVLLPDHCTGCGLCEKICPSKGIKAPATVSIDLPGQKLFRPRLHAVRAGTCTRCGEPDAAGLKDGLCARCRAELRNY